ncbi:hypothetical protein [Celeribacter baekdonensis]|uniref:hypothetical protein n=1 Tax=Celeribacter baekdonensis TaxID=875171 RepID=UPI0030DAB7F7
MKRFVTLVMTALFLSGCYTNPGDAAKKRYARTQNATLQNAAFQNARQVQVDGLTFNVAVVDGSYSAGLTQINGRLGDYETAVAFREGTYGLVELVTPTTASYGASQVEAAARRATGCQAKFSMGVLAFVGGGDAATMDLQALSKKVDSKLRGWRVELSC